MPGTSRFWGNSHSLPPHPFRYSGRRGCRTYCKGDCEKSTVIKQYHHLKSWLVYFSVSQNYRYTMEPLTLVLKTTRFLHKMVPTTWNNENVIKSGPTTKQVNIWFTVIRGMILDKLLGKWKSVVSDSLGLHELYSPWNSPGQNTGIGSLSLLQGIFPTQGSNPGLPHHRRILHHLSHQRSPIDRRCSTI